MAKILYVTSVLPWPLQRNGGGRRTALIGRALRELGHDVETVAIVPQVALDADAASRAGEHGVGEVVAVPSEDVRPSRLPPPLRGWVEVRRRFKERLSPKPAATAAVARRLQPRGQRDLPSERRSGSSGSAPTGASAPASRGCDYDLVVVRYGWTLASIDLPAAGGPPVVLDFDDVDWLALESRFAAEPWPGLAGRGAMAIAKRTTRTLVEARAKRAAAMWAACDEDVAALARDGLAATTLPNLPVEADGDVPEPLPPDGGSPIVLFVGDLQHGPNVDGLDRFARRIWPRVKAAVPAARFRIVGRGMSEAQRGYAAIDGVEPVGFAEDVRDEYAAASVAVAPSWWGGGTKVKVVEAAALGRAQVTTTAATRGFRPLADGDPHDDIGPALATADDDATFAREVVRLLHDDVARRNLAANGPRHVARRYAFPAFRDVVGRTVGPLLAGG